MDYSWTEPQYMCYLGIVDVVTVSENHHLDIFMTFIVDIFHPQSITTKLGDLLGWL